MKNIDRLYKTIGIVIICVVVIAALIIGARLWFQKKELPAAETVREKGSVAETPPTVLDYSRLNEDAKLKSLMQQRKEQFGIDKSLDMIAKPEESIKIGESTVSIRDIVEKIQLKKGDIIEKDLPLKHGQEPAGFQQPPTSLTSTQEAYGIYVVLPGDNIWNIHFRFLKDYFDHRSISLSPLADEPDSRGLSSGVGKLLKFSENMVYIYNIREQKIDAGLNLIHPLNKIVVFKMLQIFKLLDGIDYQYVNHIQFDGNTLWIPAEQ